jgi:hypothetical protein
MTAEQSKNKNSLSNMLFPIGGVSLALLGCAGALAGWLLRRRQTQKTQEYIMQTAQAAIPVDPWIAQREVEAAFGQQQMSMSSPPAEYTMQIPEPVPSVMPGLMQQPATPTLTYEHAEEQAFSQSASVQTPQPPLAGSETVPYVTAPAPDAALPSAEVVESSSVAYAAPDMEPLTMNLPEEVVNNLVEQDNTKATEQGLQDDPFLEAMMRQAQMGLFALPDKEPAESTSSGDARQE